MCVFCLNLAMSIMTEAFSYAMEVYLGRLPFFFPFFLLSVSKLLKTSEYTRLWLSTFYGHTLKN